MRFIGHAFTPTNPSSFNPALLHLEGPVVEANDERELPPGTMVTISIQTDYRCEIMMAEAILCSLNSVRVKHKRILGLRSMLCGQVQHLKF